MGALKVKYEECLETIAQIMSQEAKCIVTVDDVHLVVSRTTSSIYSAVVPNNASNASDDNICIVCLVRKWKSPYEYVVTTS